VLVHAPDLLDRSRVTSALPAAEVVADAASLARTAGEGDLVLVDLGRPGVLTVVAGLVEGGCRVVGFASHVDAELIADAGRRGVEVLPRSRFFRSLPELAAGGGG
jgi:hypothetical protein